MTAHPSPILRAYRPVVSSSTWRSTAKAFLDLPVTLVAVTVVGVFFSVAVSTIIVVPVAIAAGAATMVTSRWAATFDRYRFLVFADEAIADPNPIAEGNLWRRFVAELRSGPAWRALAYRMAAAVLSFLRAALLLVAWSLPLTALTAPAWVWALPADRLDIGPLQVAGPAAGAFGVVLGLLLLPIAPLLVSLSAEADIRIGRMLLGPRGEQVLTERITEVESSRARAMDAVEVERRRIERDLHDGAQARLVALAMNLGMAREKIDADPAAASALIDDAHAEAKRALVELRDLARGLHPAVLTDRGLGPALSGVASRSAIPVQVTVEVADRPSTVVEGIAYFVVCEALTNVAKHSQATTASVTVVRNDDILEVVVSDDGQGGADPRGSGLVGLRDRVDAVDGHFRIASPPGGPTSILVELPCA